MLKSLVSVGPGALWVWLGFGWCEMEPRIGRDPKNPVWMLKNSGSIFGRRGVS